jgi:hypothetical protein
MPVAHLRIAVHIDQKPICSLDAKHITDSGSTDIGIEPDIAEVGKADRFVDRPQAAIGGVVNKEDLEREASIGGLAV